MSDEGQRVLALPGPHFSSVYDLENDGLRLSDGSVIRVKPEGNAGRGTAWDVWDCSVLAALHLDQHASNLAPGPGNATVELGSGTAVAGLTACARLLCTVVLSDHPDALPQVQRSVEHSGFSARSSLHVLSLDWYEGFNTLTERLHELGIHNVGLLLAADCVWLEQLVPPFVNVLANTVKHHNCRCLIAHQKRSERVDGRLKHELASYGFSLKQLEQPSGASSAAHVRARLYELVAANNSEASD
jgi:hypothetical protein